MEPFTLTFFLIALIILSSGGILVFGLANVLINRNDIGDRLQVYAQIPDATSQRGLRGNRAQLIRWRIRLNHMLSSLTSEELSMQLAGANWSITETEFILIRILLTVVGFAFGWLISGSPFPGIGLGVILYLIPGFILNRSIIKRRSNFEKQLVDVLVLITSAVRAGYSLLQSMDVVVNEMNAPANEEFRRVRREVGLGLPLNQALENLNIRMQNDDLYLVVTAININSQVGGNLTTMLDAVTNTIRERVRLFGEVRAITSQQRISAYFLTMMPFIFAGILFVMNPEYARKLFRPGMTLCFPIGAVLFVLLGNLIIRQMIKIKP